MTVLLPANSPQVRRSASLVASLLTAGFGITTAIAPSVAGPLVNRAAPGIEQHSNVEQAQATIDGIYLQGQSSQPGQLGHAYAVFEVEENRVVGAFYMPQSSFDCFYGTVESNQFALNVVNSYSREVYPYNVALGGQSAIASTEGAIPAELRLQGFQPIEAISANDQRMLATCKADVNQGLL